MIQVRQERASWDQEQLQKQKDAEMQVLQVRRESEQNELTIASRVRLEVTQKLKAEFEVERTRRHLEHLASQEKTLMYGEDREAQWLAYAEVVAHKAALEHQQWQDKADWEMTEWERRRKEIGEKETVDREKREGEEKEAREKREEEEAHHLARMQRDEKERAEKKAADEVVRQNQYLFDQVENELLEATARELQEQRGFMLADIESAASDRSAYRIQIDVLEDKVDQLLSQNVQLSGQMLEKDKDISRAIIGVEAEINETWEKLLQDTNRMHLKEKKEEGEEWEKQIQEILSAHKLSTLRLGSSHQQFSVVQQEIIELSAQVESQKASFLAEKEALVKSFKAERSDANKEHKDSVKKLNKQVS